MRVRPQIEDDDLSCQIFKKAGFKKAPIYLSVEYAGVLDLNKTEARDFGWHASAFASRAS